MLTESFIISTKGSKSSGQNATKSDGIQLHEYRPQSTLRRLYKNSSTNTHCLGVSRMHLFAAQAEKSTVHVYNRVTGKQEATVAFQRKITALAVTSTTFPIIILGTDDGSLVFWESCTGRQILTPAAHLQTITCLALTPNNLQVLSGAADSTINVWSLEKTLSFSRSSNSDSLDIARPSFSFREHRSAIISIVSMSSYFWTNTIVSVSEDGTLHRWSLVDGQKISTAFSSKGVASLCLDPADRALYLGHDDGSVSFQDLMVPLQSANKANDMLDTDDKRNNWSSSLTLSDSILCMTLTYDATVLLTGHRSGRVSAWNIAKQTYLKELNKLENPVTNIAMLIPDGLAQDQRAIGSEVIKPRLDLSNTVFTKGTSDVPINYTINAQINRGISDTSTGLGITEDGWPDHILRNGIEALRSLNEDLK